MSYFGNYAHWLMADPKCTQEAQAISNPYERAQRLARCRPSQSLPPDAGHRHWLTNQGGILREAHVAPRHMWEWAKQNMSPAQFAKTFSAEHDFNPIPNVPFEQPTSSKKITVDRGAKSKPSFQEFGKRKGYGGVGSPNKKSDPAENAMLMVFGFGFLLYVGWSGMKFFADLDAERQAAG
jgi:hypothetical protein